ncbi:hypothetical protein BCR42DRAFT_422587 [Absidia repens]|uniref:CCHC-type domain-containing protein n=1 Tax=Absidia repens TaxID=90262 RepID=A0A1X2I6S0_9FUNG|nr:hypothetical protein BCR42DRAFT_422587 [Absidia repens]
MTNKCNQHSQQHRKNQSNIGRNYYGIPGINTSGGQCSWCGKYGHKPSYCPYLR